jgi:hypothetical protein
MARAKLDTVYFLGASCVGCGETIRSGDVLSRSAGYWWHRHPGQPDHVTMEPVHKPAPRRRPPNLGRRSVPSRKRRAGARRRGRPPVFIAALVVARAAELYGAHRQWSAVLEALEAEGNGTYARNTLIRRTRKYSRSQKSTHVAGGAAGPEQLGRTSTKRRRRKR